jgi:hypothetical protein
MIPPSGAAPFPGLAIGLRPASRSSASGTALPEIITVAKRQRLTAARGLLPLSGVLSAALPAQGPGIRIPPVPGAAPACEQWRRGDHGRGAGAPLGRAGGKPQRSCASSTPCSRRRETGAVSVGQMSSRGSRLGAAVGNTTGNRISLNASR